MSEFKSVYFKAERTGSVYAICSDAAEAYIDPLEVKGSELGDLISLLKLLVQMEEGISPRVTCKQ